MEAIKNTLAENLGGKAHEAASSENQFSLEQCPDLSGKVAVVTGGSQGIGYGATHTMLSKNIAKVFILSTDPDTINGATDAIAKEMGEETAKRTKWIQCDLSDWSAVTKVAKQISDETDRLDILINNAGRGIMTQQLTDMGVDRHMAINHCGHVILTSHLLPLIKKTAKDGFIVRISNQASNAHQSAGKDTKFDSLEEWNKDYGPNTQYGRSKLANILYSRYLAKHLTSQNKNILVNATHPGVVSTKMSKEDIHEPFPLGGYAMSVGLEPFKKDQFEGAVSTVFAATTIEKSGCYICPPAVEEAGSELSQDMDLAETLMRTTVQIIREKTKSESEDKGCPFDLY